MMRITDNSTLLLCHKDLVLFRVRLRDNSALKLFFLRSTRMRLIVNMELWRNRSHFLIGHVSNWRKFLLSKLRFDLLRSILIFLKSRCSQLNVRDEVDLPRRSHKPLVILRRSGSLIIVNHWLVDCKFRSLVW